MLASTWMDPVLGLDTHIVGIPAPPAPVPVPTPVPMPFIGMVFDPIGAAFGAALGAGPVMVNGMPATNCGTNVTNMMSPHLPAPGVIFIPPPKPAGDAELMFGALDVSFGGTLAVRLGEIALSCSDPRRMPTSVVLAVPKGPPVLIMRPPVPDVACIAMAAAFRGLFRGLGAVVRRGGRCLRAMQRAPGSRWRRASSAVHDMVERMAPRRVRDAMHRAVCFLTGHPVDVASGRVLTDHVEFTLPGALPLRFERLYSSSLSWRDGPLGRGWSHSLDQAVWLEPHKVVYQAEDGREIEFDTTHLPDRVIRAGQAVYHPVDRLSLRCLAPWRFEIETPDGVVREFGPVADRSAEKRSKLLGKRNRVGDRIDFTYDARGRLETARDSVGRIVLFEHDRHDRVVRVSVAPPEVQRAIVQVEYEYDEQGDLVTARDAAGHPFRFAYVDHLLVQETNRNGLSFYFQYDGLGAGARCVRTWGDGGIYDHEITYDAAARKTLVESSLGHVTVYAMNEAGQVIAVTDALGATTKYEYDDRTGQKSKETDPVGGETVWAYDTRGNCVETAGPDGATVQITYDEMNLPIRAVDPMEAVWQWGHDAKGRLIGRVDPLGRRTQYEWDGSRLVTFHDPAGQVTRLFHDERGNLSTVRTPDGAEARWTWDGFGRCVRTTDAHGNHQTRERDLLGRPIRVLEADGNVRELAYDPEGNVVHARDKLHDVRFTYLGMNRLASRSEAGTTVKFAYDTEEQLIGIQNEHGLVYRFEPGPTGEIDAETGFDRVRRRYERDAAGRVKKVRRPAGRTSDYTYDAAGRVVTVAHSDGTEESYTYRHDGELITAANGTVTLVFERDPLGRITRELSGDDWVASQYDPLGFRTRITSSKGMAQDIRRNAMGDALGVTAHVDHTPPPRASHPATFSATFRRDEMGLEIERTLPGGVRSTWTRDRLGRPLRQEIWSGTTQHASRQYHWEPNDRLRSIVDTLQGPAGTTYRHDTVGNLAAAFHQDGQVDLRMPDAVGNLFRTESRSDRRYGPAGQLLEAHGPDGVTRFEYDPEGNLTKKILPDDSVWRYDWNDAGRLTRVMRPDGESVEFGYDALGRRTWKRFRGNTTRWIWDGNVPLHEWVERAHAPATAQAPAPSSGNDDISRRGREASMAERWAQGPPERGTADAPVTWLFEPESFAPLAKLVGDQRYSIVTDHLGTPCAMFDGAGQKVWSAAIDAYGDLREVAGDRQACPFRWPGQYEDPETGLHYNRFRYYDPAAGEYVSQDPLRMGGGWRLYAYTRDPLTWIDPLALSGQCVRVDGEFDTLYRAMSREDYGTFLRTGRMPGTTETFTSPTQAFSEGYQGVLVRFQLAPGTIDNLRGVGVRAHGRKSAALLPDLPQVKRGWGRRNAMFKPEGEQVNIGLGTGRALDIFNDSIRGFEVLGVR